MKENHSAEIRDLTIAHKVKVARLNQIRKLIPLTFFAGLALLILFSISSGIEPPPSLFDPSGWLRKLASSALTSALLGFLVSSAVAVSIFITIRLSELEAEINVRESQQRIDSTLASGSNGATDRRRGFRRTQRLQQRVVSPAAGNRLVVIRRTKLKHKAGVELHVTAELRRKRRAR